MCQNKKIEDTLLCEMLELVSTIKEYGESNPKMTNNILGQSILNKVEQLHNKINLN